MVRSAHAGCTYYTIYASYVHGFAVLCNCVHVCTAHWRKKSATSSLTNGLIQILRIANHNVHTRNRTRCDLVNRLQTFFAFALEHTKYFDYIEALCMCVYVRVGVSFSAHATSVQYSKSYSVVLWRFQRCAYSR